MSAPSLRAAAAALLVALVALPVLAHDPQGHAAAQVEVGSLVLTQGFSRATRPGAPVAGGFLTIANTGSVDDRLVGASSAVAGHMEVHEMTMTDGVMTMRELAGGLPIPASATVTLQPGGFHVMFMELSNPSSRARRWTSRWRSRRPGTSPCRWRSSRPTPRPSRPGTEAAMSLRSVRLILWAAAFAAAIASAWFLVLRPRFQQSLSDELGRGAYTLVATDGGTFNEQSLKGHPSAVFFGFTHCPEVCPTTLGDIATWIEELGPDAKDLRFWFVTVDPERDTVDMLRDYVSWTPGVVGASGSEAEVAKAIAAFKVYARKVPLDGGDYTMDHTAYVMLFDGDGRFDQVIAYQEPTDSALAKLRDLVSQG